MSTINSKNVQVGTSGVAAQNFTLYQPATPDGTVRLGVGNTGATTLDVLTATSAGNVTMGGTTTLTNISYSGTLTGGTGVVNLGSGQVYKDASGNVGIGTSSPSTYANGAAPTLVVGTGNNWVVAQPRTDGPAGIANGVRLAGNYLTNPKPGAAVWIGAAGGAGQRGVLAFFTKDTDDNTNEPTERARIESGGNFIFKGGSTDLTLNQTSTSRYWQHNKASSEGAGFTYHVFQNAGSGIGSITWNGSGTSFNTTSDYRLKENVQPMVGALSKVAALKPCTYTWKADGSAGEGFIAHELAAVAPQCVAGGKDAVDENGNPVYQGIDTSFLVSTLTAAIQEQQAMIESLTARITALEAK